MRLIRRHYTDLLGLGLILGALLFAYFPLLSISFVFNDDLLRFANPVNTCADHPQFFYFFLVGRPVFPLLACPFWTSVQGVADLAPARLINIFALSIPAFVFFKWLGKNHFSPLPALLLSIIIFISPTFQTQVVLANSFPHMAAVLLAVLSGIQVCTWLADEKQYRLVTAGLLLFLSLSIHPCVAMFFWPVVFVYVYAHKTGGRKIVSILVWFFILCGLYFLFARFMYAVAPCFFHVASDIVGGHEVAVTDSLFQCWYKFRHFLWAALRLWAVVPQVWIPWSVLALFVAAVVIKGIQLVRSRGEDGLLHVFFLLFTVPLSLLPILAAHYNCLSYRMISGLTAIVVLMVFLSLRKIFQVSPFKKAAPVLTALLLVLLATMYIRQARFNLRVYLAVPAHQEMAYVKEKLRHIDKTRIETVHVIRPEHPNWLHRKPVGGDEFGLLSSAAPQNVRGLVRCALKELHFDEKYINRLKITTAAFHEKAVEAKAEDTVVVDMNAGLPRILPPEANRAGKYSGPGLKDLVRLLGKVFAGMKFLEPVLP